MSVSIAMLAIRGAPAGMGGGGNALPWRSTSSGPVGGWGKASSSLAAAEPVGASLLALVEAESPGAFSSLRWHPQQASRATRASELLKRTIGREANPRPREPVQFSARVPPACASAPAEA